MSAKDKKVVKKGEKLELPSRIHITEYLRTAHSDMSRIQKAGFELFVGEKSWMPMEEWESVFKKYSNRGKIKEGEVDEHAK